MTFSISLNILHSYVLQNSVLCWEVLPGDLIVRAECTKFLCVQSVEYSSEVLGLRLSLEKEVQRREQLEQELRAMKSSSSRKSLSGNLQKQSDELLTVRQRLDDELKERERLEAEVRSLREQVGLLSDEGDEVHIFALEPCYCDHCISLPSDIELWYPDEVFKTA